MERFQTVDDGIIEIVTRSNPGDFAIYRIEDGKLKKLYVSESLAEMSGMSSEEYQEATSDDASALVIPSDRQKIAEKIKKVLENGGTEDFVYRVRHKNLGSILVHAHGRVIGMYDGSPALAVTYSRTSNEAEGSMQLLDLSSEILYVMDRQTYEILYANGVALDLWGHGDYSEQRCYQYVNGLGGPCPWCSVPLMKDGEYHTDAAYSLAQDMWFSIDCRVMDWYGRDAVAVYAHDVTEAQRLRQSIESEKNTLGDILGNIPGGVALFSVRGTEIRLEYANDGFYDVHHGSRKYWKDNGMDPANWSFSGYENVPLKEIRSIARGEKPVGSFSYSFVGEDEKIHWVNNRFKFAFKKDGANYYYASFTDIDDEKAAEQEVLKSRQMYDDAAKTAKLIIWEYDIAGRRAIMLRTGYTDEICEKYDVPDIIENVPDSLLPYVDEADRSKFFKAYEMMARGSDYTELDFRFRLPVQESIQYERIIMKRIYDREGNFVSVYCSGQNITDVRQSEARFNKAYEMIENPNSYGSFHLNMTKNLCGSGAKGRSGIKNVLDLQKSGTVDGYFRDFSKLIDDEEIMEAFSEVFNRDLLLRKFGEGVEKVSIEYPVMYENGDRHWREGFLSMMKNPNTGDIEAVTYSFDIDAKKRNEIMIQNLTEGQFDYIGIIKPHADTFEFLSRKPEITIGNSGGKLDYTEFCEHLRKRFTDASEIKLFDEIISLDKVLNELDAKGRVTASYMQTTEEGINCARLQYSWFDRREGSVMVVCTDITDIYERERSQMEKIKTALNEADRANEAKSTFLSSMSHDLRTPLNGIIGFTEFAINETDPEKKRDYLEKVRTSGQLMQEMINDTLILSRIESGKEVLDVQVTREKDITEPVVTALRMSAEMKHISLEAYYGTDADSMIWMDRTKMQKIILNLISNAIKYTGEGGRVTVTAETLDPPQGGMNRKLTVEDTGIGMSEEFRRVMFEPFSQEKRSESSAMEGTGLGLSIVKKYTEILGGRIEVESEIHKGTRITVLMHVVAADDADIASADDDAQASSGNSKKKVPRIVTDVAAVPEGTRILLCEDNRLNTEIASMILMNAGLEVEHAENGSVAVDMFAASADRYYDLILMDIRMPVMDGYEATKAIRSLGRSDAGTVPIIAMTADVFEESIRDAKDSGMNGYVMKPVNPAEMFRTVAEALPNRP